MQPAITSVLDHVAIAVPDADAASARWTGAMGGGHLSHGDNGVFASRQLRFAGGGKLELLTPSPQANGGGFVGGFLNRFGAGIHHVTLKVPNLPDAVATVRGNGLDVVDVQDVDDWWQEGFLRPSQVGGLIVQLAWSGGTDEEWAERVGHTPQPPRDDAARLLGPTILHPDLARARWLWTLLGATVADDGEAALRCTWPDSPLDVRIEEGAPAGPTVLRVAGAGAHPPDPDLGPAVIPQR
jgi:catechol 2,3-dioxygenase-like lactoylglutathione lyase family enzyme